MINTLLTKKSPGVVALIDEMERVRKIENDRFYDMACDLFDMAQETGNDDLKDLASCTLGDALWQNKRFSESVYYLTAGLQGLLQTDEYRLICRCYNELGIIMRHEGNFIASEENYLSSIDVARNHRMYFQEAIACANFGALCEEMGAMQECLEYHYRSVECVMFVEDPHVKNTFLVGEYAMIAIAYVVLGSLEDAKRHLDEMNRLHAEYPDSVNDFDVAVSNWLYYFQLNDKVLSDKFKIDSIKAFEQCEDVMEYFDEIEILIQLLLKEKSFDVMDAIFKGVEEKLGDIELFNLRLHLERWKIRMYESTGDSVLRDRSAYNYFQFHAKKSEETKRSFTTTLRLKNELIQQKTKNLFLSAAAETDTLTGLANRAKLNTVIDELFALAVEKGKSLGVEMMDLDFFKQVNDNYGHAKGDMLLATIGRHLRGLITDKIFIARYGGDEFVIYYFDMSDDEILEVVRKIRTLVEEIRVELDIDKLSTSQGIINRIPSPENRTWDYLNTADYTLYFVKEHGKANARLVHGRADLESEEWDKVF